MPPLNEQVVDSVTASNFKNLGDAPAFYTSLAMGNAVAHQNRMAVVAEAATSSAVKKLTELDPAEAVAVLKATSGNEVASQLSSIMAALSSNQQSAKVAQTTPPTT